MKHLSPRTLAGAKLLAGTALDVLRGKPSFGRKFLMDQFVTYDAATYDSAGAFLIGELERLDPKVHEPLYAATWSRDIDLRTDVQQGDTSSSYIISAFAQQSGPTGSIIPWASQQNTTIVRTQLDGRKIVNPLDLVEQEVSYTVADLIQSQAIGRPIDSQMIGNLNTVDQMGTDQAVYVGDAGKGTTGLINNANVTNTGNVVNGAAASPLWSSKTPQEILKDVNEILASQWASTGYAAPSTKLLLPPVQFGFIATQTVSSAGNESILKYVAENNILTAQFKKPLEILPSKWCAAATRTAAGFSASSDRMVAYNQSSDFVRFPKVPLAPLAPQYRGVWIAVPYWGRLGVLEVIYPEAVAYRDGL